MESGEIDLYHLTEKLRWLAAVETNTAYYPPTYEQDGFTHATSDPSLLLEVANHFYCDVPGEWLCLHMTVASVGQTGVDVIFERAAPVGERAAGGDGAPDAPLFPHLYGGIHPAAVLRALPVTRADGGTFVAIEGITG